MNRTNTLLVLAIAGTGLLAACGGDDGSTPAVAAAPAPAVASAPPATSTTITAAAGSTVAVKSAESDLGPILVGVDGRTLYGFTNDTPIQSNCESTCAEAWPPVIVAANWTVAPGLDSGIFNTITRPDGTLQLVAGKYPLYAYSGDTAPGDVNGQGSGDVWFVVDPDGALVEGDAATEDAATEDTTEDATDGRRPTEDATTDDRAGRRRGAAQGRVHRRDAARRGARPTPTDSRSTASPTTATATRHATTPAPTRGRRCWSTATRCPTVSTPPCSASSSATTGRTS